MTEFRSKYFTESRDNITGYGSSEYSSYINDRTLLPFFLILFLISPVLALISAIFNYRKNGARLTVYLFMAVIGYTFIVVPGMDADTVSSEFLDHFQKMSPTEFFNDIYAMITLSTTESQNSEPYITVLSYLLASFTDDRNIFMMFVGLIFGLGYIKGISLVYEEREGSWTFTTLLLFVLFISWIHIVGINHPRNYTGGCIFFVGAYLYIKNQEYKYLFLVLTAPFFHFMFLVVSLPFFIYVVFRDKKYVYVTILALSFLASAELSILESVLTTTELGENKVELYTGGRWDSDTPPSSFEKSQSFHAEYYREIGRWAVISVFIFGITFMGYFSGKYHDRLQNGLGSVAILTLSFSNFTKAVPALSSRTMTYFGLFAIAYLIRLYSNDAVKKKAYHWVVYLGLPAFLLYIFTMASRAGDFIDFKVLVSPFLYPFLSDDPVSLKEFLRTILDL